MHGGWSDINSTTNGGLFNASLIPQRLAVLQHIFHPRPGLVRRQQLHKVVAFEVEQPLLVHKAARFHERENGRNEVLP